MSVTEEYYAHIYPTANDTDKSDSTSPTKDANDENNDYHRSEEQVNVCLESSTSKLKELKRRYLRCSSHCTITHLKKFIALKLYNNKDKFKDVSTSACFLQELNNF